MGKHRGLKLPPPKKEVFVSGRVSLWSSRVTTRAQCFQSDSWLVEVYCKASSHPLKRDYSSEGFFLSTDLPKGLPSGIPVRL